MQEQFKPQETILPYDVVSLPSGGIYYTNKKKSVKVTYLNASDENLLASAAARQTDLVDNLLDSATRISVPEELTRKGLFNELLEIFCTSRIRATSPEELLTGKPWTDGGLTFFKLSSLQDFLRRHGFTDYTRGQITERLKELNNGASSDKEYRFKDSRDKWRKVRVWFIPEMKRGEVELPDVEIDEDTPF